MKHVKTLSQCPMLQSERPQTASNDVPVSLILVFIQDVLGAVLNLFLAKETVGTPQA